VAATVAALVLATVGIFAVTREVAAPWRVVGPSMEPTLRPGDHVLVDRWTYRHRPPRPGEIVLLAGPSGEPWIKRVGVAPEPGEGLWLVGDNAARSLDSRRLGPMPVSRCRGRVIVRYWPPSRAGRLR